VSDGIYVVRTSLPAEALDDAATVRSYKSLSLVERAFRCIKTVDLQVRPVHHWLAGRVRAHVCLCMLASHGIFSVNPRHLVTFTTPFLGSVLRARCKNGAERRVTSHPVAAHGGRTIIRHALGAGLGKAEPNY
jgi:hypothetical protein